MTVNGKLTESTMKRTKTVFGLTALMMTLMGVKNADSAKDKLVLTGSSTVAPLAAEIGKRFESKHPGIRVDVQTGGSSRGVTDARQGLADIGMASRALNDDEKDLLAFPIAQDGICVIVHKDNPISKLEDKQVIDIYTGKITNWKEVGGKDAPIIIYGRENSSGTYSFFKEHVLENKDFANSVQTLPGTAAVVNAVKKDVNGIGYGGAGYAKEIKECPIKKDATGTALLPIKENIDNNSYPLSRNLYLYTSKAPEGKTKEFIDWILTPAGQEVVTKEGYFAVK